ncbi:transglycosylase SLT domain-containing protein [Thiolapillus sp.]
MTENRHPRIVLFLKTFLLLAGLLLLAGPGTGADDQETALPLLEARSTDDLPTMKKRRVIRALVVFGPTDFFFIKGKPSGLQADLLREYEKFINKGIKRETEKIHLVFVPVPFSKLIPWLQEGRGDIAAHFLTETPERQKSLLFASGRRMKVSELVVANRNIALPDRIEGLAGKTIQVLPGSSYLEHLQALNRQFREKGLPPMDIQPVDPNLNSEDILEMVNAGVIGMTVIDDYKAKLWAQALPNIQVNEQLAIHRDGYVGWAVRRNNPELAKSLQDFSKKVRKGTLLGNMFMKRYYKSTRWIKNPAREQAREKFEQLLALFRKYGDRYGFDALALAAQGYQESELDQSRRSHRGAVGIMQLLPSTAADKNVGIKDISTEENNIHAGARYLAFLRDRYFSDPSISPEDRMAFSWAAYNAGPAKVRKMRGLAEKMGLDPNRWFGNVEIAAGKIVGRETVRYVANIYKYYIAYRYLMEAENRRRQDAA